ncbi:MAG: VanZ family protein, partial [Elusimicrobia bacterium]|nr:VanZ family protein [Elusimicrobiota bacterium]
WFSTDDAFRKKTINNLVFCIGFVFFIGILDEVFQWFLPTRVGDIRDVLFNAAGGLWGVVLRILKS